MLTSFSAAPDPGRLRLRAALRAVLGIGLAAALCLAAGPPLPAVVAGGLAALLALFTVTDPAVRGQAATTALLPAAGLPVLALAAGLHGIPVVRDLALLAVVGAGVCARRWGPRGHALGVFAFMMFFVAQFLHAVPGLDPRAGHLDFQLRSGHLWGLERALAELAGPLQVSPERLAGRPAPAR